MPWEQIGGVGVSSAPYGWDLSAWSLRFAKEYIVFACGEPPPGVALDVVFHDHELGSYPDLGIWYECNAPYDYIRRCEHALEVFNGAVAWSDLEAHLEELAAAEEEREDDDDESDEGGDEDAGAEAVFTVHVADNFHYMDDNETYTYCACPTWTEAVAAAREIVERFLAAEYQPGMTAEMLFAKYTSFGEDPYIVPTLEGAGFSAWDYARRRCAEMCAGEPQ